MASAVVGALRVTLGLDSAQFTDGLSKAQKNLKAAGSQLQSIGRGMATVGAGMTAAITAPLIGLGAMAVAEASEMRDALGQVNAALKSMGDVGGRSLEQLTSHADKLASTSLFEDDQILRGVTANLLTFGNVAGTAFDRAQQAAVDLSARMGGDLQASTLMIGKALNAPTKGLAALRRVGIQFTKSQEDQIKAMDAAGNAAGAQAIMLSELERQFGGSAEAARNAAHPMERMRLSLAAMAGDIGTILLPFVDKMAVAFAGITEKFGQLSPGMQQFVVVGGLVAAALGPILVAAGALVASLGVLIPIVGAISLPFLAVGAAVVAVGAAFWVFRDDIMPILKDLWETLKATLGPALQELFAAVKVMAAQLGAAFKEFIESDAGKAVVAFAAMMQKLMGGLVIQVLKGLILTVTQVIKGIAALFSMVSALLRGDWSAAWEIWKSGVIAVGKAVGDAIASLASSAVRFIAGMVQGVGRWLTGKLFDVLNSTIEKVKGVSDAFFRLYDAVVGHSYVPDMVNGIAEWMAKLDAGMVVPARNATDKTRAAFESLRDDVAGIFDRMLTDSERATRQLAQDIATLDQALAKGIITRTQRDQAAGGAAAIGLEKGDRMSPLGPMADGRDLAAVLKEGTAVAKETTQAIQDKLRASAEDFGDRFAYAVESALNGDIRGVFEAIFGDLRSILSNIGQSLFRAFQGGGGNGGGGLMSAIASMFGGGNGGGVPGFKTGGGFTVGGAPGADRNLVAFRATKGEMVDIRRPGQNLGGGGSPVHFDLRGAVMTSDLLQQMEGMAVSTGGAAFNSARQQVPADMARANRYSLGRR